MSLKDGERIGGGLVYSYQDDSPDLSYEEEDWMGSVFPTLTGGIQALAGWQNWQLTVSAHGDRGQTIRHYHIYDALVRHYLETLGDKSARIHSSDFARSDYSVLDASFFRIDQIRLDYIFRSNLRLYASLDNWFLFTRYPGSDPEMALTQESFGLETATYPTSKRVVFGLEVGF